MGVKTRFIAPGSPWENGCNGSFNGTLGDELLKRGIFYTLEEARFIIERWRQEYNPISPHSSLDYSSPAPETVAPWTVPAGGENPPGLTYGVVQSLGAGQRASSANVTIAKKFGMQQR